MLLFSVKNLLAKPAGACEYHDISEKIVFDKEDNIVPLSELSGRVKFIRLPHEINVQADDFEITVEMTCSRCLKKYPQKIRIAQTERTYSIDLDKEDIMPGEDIYFLDKKTGEIFLFEMVRQEILLQFPAVPVCSESCKGLCDICGINRNKETCACVRARPEEEKPLSILKKLISK